MQLLKTFGAGVAVAGLLAFALPGAALSGGELSPFAGLESIGNAELDQNRGREHLVCDGLGCEFGIGNANAHVHGNHATGGSEGINNLTESFSNATGLFNIVQNTGNNAVIQTTIDVHVTEMPAAQ